jgi:hypothetical protein
LSEGNRGDMFYSINSEFSFSASRAILGPAHSPVQWVPAALSPEVKRHPSSADCNDWSYNSTPPVFLHSVALSSARDTSSWSDIYLSTGTNLLYFTLLYFTLP